MVFGGCRQLPVTIAVQHEAYLYSAFVHALGKVDDLLKITVVFGVAGFCVGQPAEKTCLYILSPAYQQSALPLHMDVPCSWST